MDIAVPVVSFTRQPETGPIAREGWTALWSHRRGVSMSGASQIFDPVLG